MSAITTHVLDQGLGKPAIGVRVVLEQWSDATGSNLNVVGDAKTDADGRVRDWSAVSMDAGTYRLTFFTAEYFGAQKRETFYPKVTIDFEIVNTKQHYHVPLLLNAYGFSTYRGS
jgi:5-hydroxyisourate hydrolase